MADAMDSKSISRKGVGVQVPASAPDDAPSLARVANERLASDAYLRAALPALLHRLNNATQVLTALNALATLPGGGEMLAKRASDLADVVRVYDASGWLLATFGSALGARTLNERRDRAGLAHVVELARELARRDGRDLVVSGTAPDLDATEGDGWEPAWALGRWLHAATAAAPEHATVSVELARDAGELVVSTDAPWSDARARDAAAVVERVEGLRAIDGGRCLGIGERWLAKSTSTVRVARAASASRS